MFRCTWLGCFDDDDGMIMRCERSVGDDDMYDILGLQVENYEI